MGEREQQRQEQERLEQERLEQQRLERERSEQQRPERQDSAYKTMDEDETDDEEDFEYPQTVDDIDLGTSPPVAIPNKTDDEDIQVDLALSSLMDRLAEEDADEQSVDSNADAAQLTADKPSTEEFWQAVEDMDKVEETKERGFGFDTVMEDPAVAEASLGTVEEWETFADDPWSEEKTGAKLNDDIDGKTIDTKPKQAKDNVKDAE